MTSNIPGGRAGAEAHFKPEFINRLDDIVEFESLTREQIGEIVDLQVARLIERVRERGIEVELTDAARELLGNLGYDPTYGARPLKRVIQKRLVDPLALALLEGDFREGDTVRVDAADGELVFARAARLRCASSAAKRAHTNAVRHGTTAGPRGLGLGRADGRPAQKTGRHPPGLEDRPRGEAPPKGRRAGARRDRCGGTATRTWSGFGAEHRTHGVCPCGSRGAASVSPRGPAGSSAVLPVGFRRRRPRRGTSPPGGRRPLSRPSTIAVPSVELPA